MGLCSGFVLKTVLIIQRCVLYCGAELTQSQFLFCFSHCPTSERAGHVQGAGRGHRWDSWPQLTKGIFHTRCRHAQLTKLGEGKGREGCSEWWCLSSQGTVTCDGALLSWTWLNTCLLMGSSEWIPCFDLLACLAFGLPIKLSLFQPTSFLTFTLPVLSPCHCEGSEWAAVWYLVAGWG